jgi:SPP1 gp7 family putative phage head morphogenesis protein
MSLRNREYWEKRALRIEAEFNDDAEAYNKKLKQEFERAMREVQREIDIFYQRFAVDNKVSFEEARRILSRTDRNKFKRDLNGFIELVKNNIDGRFEKEIRNLSNRVRITRYQELMTRIKVILAELYDSYEIGTTELMWDTYEESYYRNLHNIQTGVEFGKNFSLLPEDAINEVIRYPWSGEDFSARIWGQNDDTFNRLRIRITQGLIQGQSVQNQSRIISNAMDVSYSNARRLVRTESNYFLNQGSLRAYEEMGVESYEYLATLDSRTSTVCRGLDGKIFKIEDARAGVNYPAMHPNCRSTTIPGLDENFADEEEFRVARDLSTNQVYTVPNMTYEAWYNQYVA